MTFDNWAIIFATLLGPVLAVQAQQWVTEWKARRERQDRLFRTLIVTRATTLSYDHVAALNSVPLEFSKDDEVMLKWRTYLDHLITKQADVEAWLTRRINLLNELIGLIANRLGYKDFDSVKLKNEIYAPQGHARAEYEWEQIRQGAVELINGKKTLPLDVRSIAQDPEMTKRIAALQEALLAWLGGKTAPRVKVDSDEPPRPRGALEMTDR